MKKYILSIDQSTSATKIMLFDHRGTLQHRVSISHKQYYPQPGFVEHDPEEILRNTLKGIQLLLKETACPESDIAALSITNQRETAMIWDRKTGRPIGRAAVWQCQRGKAFCDELRENQMDNLILEKTGLIIDPYFSASKLKWLVDQNAECRELIARGRLMAGTMDSWLAWKLSGDKVHATDYSNASRTMLLNLDSLMWDEELLSLFNLDRSMMPEIFHSDKLIGYTDPSIIFNEAVPIAGLMGDSHAALFGQHCFESGMAKVTYGTGSSIMMNIGKKPVAPPKGLVTSIGWGRMEEIDFVLEGNIHCTGDTLSWLVNDLELLPSAEASESLAASLNDNLGVYLVPAFVGLGAPHWDNQARALICGMGRGTGKAHLARAALESIAYQVRDLIDLMENAEGIELLELRVDGGPTKNNFLMQFQADMLGRPLVRTSMEEISALGSAFMAGLAVDFWKDLDEIRSLRLVDRQFEAGMEREQANILYKGWQKAVALSKQH